ncbi:hypothetical protein F8388_016325 [Cannabis sativa]|uniref:RNase H type-1 domain-containing protein n=1 Tax=Cannabis sativa TaxID=3483 RepID=A0A7J6DQ36_CANSA|nr:hypothetical protein F8388_016325 [Cannabis sativa]
MATVGLSGMIPRGAPFTVPTKVQVPAEVTIQTLIIEEGEWKTEEIASCLHKEDVPWVLGITPSKETNDTIGWSRTINGQYTVASGYKLRFRDPNIAEYSDNSANKAWWKDIEDSIWIPWAMEMLELHLAFAHKDSHQKPSKDKVSWSSPPLGSFMINTDASLIDGQPGCGLGVIIRDHLGALVTAATDYIPGCLSVLVAETLAIRLALKLAATRSMQNIFIASDSQSVITALKGQTRINTDWAHCLANWSRLVHVSDVWTSFLPDCAAASLKADLPLGASV